MVIPMTKRAGAGPSRTSPGRKPSVRLIRGQVSRAAGISVITRVRLGALGRRVPVLSPGSGEVGTDERDVSGVAVSMLLYCTATADSAHGGGAISGSRAVGLPRGKRLRCPFTAPSLREVEGAASQ